MNTGPRINTLEVYDIIVKANNPVKITKKIIEFLRKEYPNLNTLNKKFGEIRSLFNKNNTKEDFKEVWPLLALSPEEIQQRNAAYEKNRDERNDNPVKFSKKEVKDMIEKAQWILYMAENQKDKDIVCALALVTGLRMVEICRVSNITFHENPNKIYIYGLAKINKEKLKEGDNIKVEGQLLINEEIFFKGYKYFVQNYRQEYLDLKSNEDFNNKKKNYLNSGLIEFNNEKLTSFKMLRTIYANYLSSSIENIQKVLHHTNPETSKSYMNVKVEDKKEVKKEDPFIDIKLKNSQAQHKLFEKAKKHYNEHHTLPSIYELRNMTDELDDNGKVKRIAYNVAKSLYEAMEACLK
jgi:putative ubiquitin-RnfH superfamily antitoxin RatB of RatAB toxin-antitoxin module